MAQVLEFTYNNPRRNLQCLIPAICRPNTLKLVDEYYQFRTEQGAYTFYVDDKDRVLRIEPLRLMDQIIPQSIKFKLWESNYTDIILPGKTEIIHTETLVRSVKYDKHPLASEHQLCDSESIMSFCTTLKLNKKKPSYNVTYLKTALTDACMPYVYQLAKKYLTARQQINFEPIAKWCIDGNLEFVEFKRDCERIEFVTEDYGDDVWMVFSKTHPDSIYLVNGMNSACRMLAKLKFDGSIPLVGCGVALFEDYYFMPIAYRNVSINNWDNIVTMYNPKLEIRHTISKIVSMIRE